MNLPIEQKTRIYNHIGQVQRHLTELPADEQREILQSIETHIHDALENRTDGAPSLDLLEAIIAEMDPPESYGTAPLGGTETTQPKTRPTILKSIGRGYALKLILIAIIVIVYLVLDYMKESAVPQFSNPAGDQLANTEETDSDPLGNMQTKSTNQPIGNLITAGIGWTDYLIGKTRVELIQKLGAPQTNSPTWLMRWHEHPGIEAIISNEGKCREIRFNKDFEGQTVSGVKIGTSFQEVSPPASEKKYSADDIRLHDMDFFFQKLGEQGSEYHYYAAMRALGSKCKTDPKARDKILDQAHSLFDTSKSTNVRAQCIGVVADAGAKDYADFIIDALHNDRSEQIRGVAAHSLLFFKDKKLIAELKEALKTERSESVIHSIQSTIDSLSKYPD